MAMKIRVDLGATEVWPSLTVETGSDPYFDSSEAIDVPEELVTAYKDAMNAEAEAERALLAWVRENNPDAVPSAFR